MSQLQLLLLVLAKDLDVDGHTNLDNVNIAGITTTSVIYNWWYNLDN